MSNIPHIVSRLGLLCLDTPGSVTAKAVHKYAATVEVTDVGKAVSKPKREINNHLLEEWLARGREKVVDKFLIEVQVPDNQFRWTFSVRVGEWCCLARICYPEATRWVNLE